MLVVVLLNPVPVIIRLLPAALLDELIPEMVGMTLKFVDKVSGEDIIVTGPPVANAGTVVVKVVSDETVMVAGVPLKLSAGVVPKPNPLITT